jgi:CHAT domain-containing protein
MNLGLKVPTRTFARIALASGVIVASLAQAQTTSIKDQIAAHEQKLADARSSRQYRDVLVELNELCGYYRQAGDMEKALDDCNRALRDERLVRAKPGVALTQTLIGRIYSDEGDEQKALDLFNQALPVWRELGSKQGEANTLNNMGRTYSNLAQEDKALDLLNQALPMWRELGNKQGEASTLDNMGKVYSDTSQGTKSLDCLNQALVLWRAIGEQAGEALTLNNLGRTYSDLGEKQKALDAYSQSIKLWQQIGIKQGEASALDDLGRLYSSLGQKQTGLDYYNQGLPLWRASGNRNGEALDLNDIGRAHEDMGHADQALDFYNQALTIWRAVGNRRGEAMTMSNLSRDYLDLGQTDKGLQIAFDALPVWREVQETRGEAMALALAGVAYARQGHPQTALPYSLAAMEMAKAAGDPDIQGWIASSLMLGFQNQHRPEIAIFFGLEAVNDYQQIRKNIAGLDKDLQAGFAQSRASTYRTLAELLVETGRLGEAEQVLDLLKEQELKDVVRGAAGDAAAKVEPLRLSAAQQTAESELESRQQKSIALEDMRLEYLGLQSKTARTAAEDARMNELAASLQQWLAEAMTYFTGTIAAGLEQKSAASDDADGARQSYLQNSLAKLGPRVMGIRILLGQDHAYAIVVTADARKKFELPATPAQIRAKAFEALQAIQGRRADAQPKLAELYAMVAAPIEGELKTLEKSAPGEAGVPTLLWSLDDALRYLPMAALYDGQHYLLERFNNVLFTPESYGHMADVPLASAPSVLALGLSKSYGGLPPLPGVMPELDSVVHDPAAPESHGPMAGKLLPNDQFTLAALETELGQDKGFPVVHIASHFVVEAGTGQEPYLMLGGDRDGQPGGYQWDLSEMEHSAIAFHGTRLLTLSACSTAKDYENRNGTEMDSLGMVAQQKDAEAVLATLWDVNDASTSRLISDFYARWLKDPAAGKAEALRHAQLALLKSEPAGEPVGEQAAGAGKSQRGFEAVEGQQAPQVGYEHPYYWAPFVLIGNFH